MRRRLPEKINDIAARRYDAMPPIIGARQESDAYAEAVYKISFSAPMNHIGVISLIVFWRDCHICMLLHFISLLSFH